MDPYIGEIRAFAFGQTPTGWIPCDGRSLAISTNQALFALIGQTYGGTGNVNFNIPDLRGTTMMSNSNSVARGTRVGTETVSLAANNVPVHTHYVTLTTGINNVASEGTGPLVAGSFPAAKPGFPTITGDDVNPFVTPSPSTPLTQLNPATVSTAGTSQAHANMMPYMAVQLCICVTGLFPPRP